MSDADETAGLRERVDAAIVDLGAAIVDLGARLEGHERADAVEVDRLRDCLGALRAELDAVAVRVADLERRARGVLHE